MAVRHYKKGDEDQILKLFEKVFRKTMSYKEWKWKYLDNPNRHEIPFTLVFEEDGKILGHTSLWVHKAVIDGEQKQIGLRIDTMVDPDARGKGIYRKLSERLIVDAEKEGISLLYGFPAPKAKELQIRYIGAHHLTDVHRWVYMNKPFSVAASKIKLLKVFSFLDPIYRFFKRPFKKRSKKVDQYIQKVNTFDREFSFSALDEQVFLKRDTTYLNWRYVHHPINKYEILQWLEQDTVKGYVVYRTTTNEKNLRIGFIVDLVATGENSDQIQLHLLEKALENMRSAHFIQAWTLPGQRIEKIFKKARFFQKDSPMPIVIRNINLNNIDLNNPANWFISMGDVDSF